MSCEGGPVDAVVPEPIVPAPSPPAPEELALLSADDVQAAVLESALASPIEDWMTFLHPEQAKTIRRSWNGPARIRGAAGTGKTVVGLHRAAYLASSRPGRILYTSFVRTLPQVLRELYTRLAPTTLDRVDFVSTHRFAIDLLKSRGVSVKVDLSGAKAAYRAAWAEVGKPGALKRVPQPWTYWEEEIQYVIKGRGLTRFDEYAGLDRVGRRYPLTVEQRRAVWDLHVAYQRHLTERGVHDLADVFLLAEQQLRVRPLDPGYVAVVVDEVQDLSCAAVRMLHALVGDRPDGLLLIGDGQQSVYPGGFTLQEAGVAVTGRAVVLRHNYRNTEEILDAASAVVARDRFSDLDGLEELGERDVVCVRSGRSPIRVDASDVSSHDAAMLTAIAQATEHVGVDHGDVAVLAARHKTLDHYRTLLHRAGVPFVDLEKYDGRPAPRVKLGTFKRAKGLEFKHVFLPQLVDGPSTRWTDETAEAYRERVELERRELFVGMTRARDGLWLGYVSAARP
jgi:superfamily I DNA/RNA helicase